MREILKKLKSSKSLFFFINELKYIYIKIYWSLGEHNYENSAAIIERLRLKVHQNGFYFPNSM
jgi:hypothetical protein